jgi:polar amino acid transport system substrate-binding protein
MAVSLVRASQITAAAVAAVTLACATACSSSSGSSSPAPASQASGASASAPAPASAPDSAALALVPSSIRGTGQIVLGSEIDYPPFDDYNANKVPFGLDFDLVDAAAKVLDLKVEIQNIQVPSLIPSLQAGRIDLATDGFFITAERLQVVNFVKVYEATNSLLVSAGNPGALTGTTTCGKKIAIEAGTQEADLMNQASALCAKAGKPQPVITTFPTLTAQTLAIESGRVQGGPMGTAPAAYVAKTTSGKLVVAPGIMPGGTIAIGIMVPKGNGLGAALAAAFKILVSNGTYASILEKYGVSSSAVTPTLVS